MHSSGEALTSAWPSLTQRLFDPAEEVRLEVVKAAAKLMSEWTYR